MTEDASGPVQLVAEFTALPGREEEVERLLLALTAQVRREPGCLDFTPLRVATAPVLEARPTVVAGPAPAGRRFVVTETYRDAAAFAAHLAAPYGAPFNAALGPLIEEDGSQLTFVEPLA
ncbi:antibiotic biosynthesis monooxygenase [Agromyces endophyticus]|uniref:putative quinol monooxygenase n=1 Tax=Agromyces sp. H17E-10 TaxID=2932244 RepID=UPI001FD61374|nr:antibiotic biosynthesis monooxygenase family protein [Agromyces sp. H17E-10]UOQ90533.1 antibiotic biosynthesis monooxygenase [Agromyces sp. H17E-10]